MEDVAVEYLRSVVDMSGLRDACDEDAIHFVTLRMAWDADVGRWWLGYHSAMSADTEGRNIYDKGLRSGVF